jgi:primary-amine oxidase
MGQHPLDPLAPDEFRTAADILRREQALTPSWRFASIELKEPAKAEVRAWRAGDPVPRTAFVVLLNREDNTTWEAVVDLTGNRVVSWTHIPGVTPHFTVDEYHDVDLAMRSHPDVIAALAERGITDLSRVLIEVWTYGKAMMPEQWRDLRLGWCDIWYRETPEGNPYAHPVSGLKVVVDVNTLELLELENDHDHGQPTVNAEYVPGPWTGEQRSDLKPLNITQPHGVSFTV